MKTQSSHCITCGREDLYGFFLNTCKMFYRIHHRHISSKCHQPMLKIHHLQKESQIHIRKEKLFPIKRLQAVKYVYKLEVSYTLLRKLCTSCSGQCPSSLSPPAAPPARAAWHGDLVKRAQQHSSNAMRCGQMA